MNSMAHLRNITGNNINNNKLNSGSDSYENKINNANKIPNNLNNQASYQDCNYLNAPSVTRSNTDHHLSYNPISQPRAPSNTPSEDYLISPLSLNLNINKIKKNANINNLSNLSSNLAKLTNNLSTLNNLSSLTSNLPNFENMAELNSLIGEEEDSSPSMNYEKATPPTPCTPQNTPQYKHLHNGKAGWICSSCKNFNYESK